MKDFIKKHELVILFCFQLFLAIFLIILAGFILLSNECTFEGRDASLVIGGGCIGLYSFCFLSAYDSFLLLKNRKSPDPSGDI